MSDEQTQRPWLRVAEIAKRSGTSKRTIQRYLQDGKFPGAAMVDGVWQVPLEDVLAAGVSIDGTQKLKSLTAVEEMKERAEKAEAELARVRRELDSTKDRLIAALEGGPKQLGPGETSKVEALESKIDSLVETVEALARGNAEREAALAQGKRRGWFGRK